jgi:hypothetical protein
LVWSDVSIHSTLSLCANFIPVVGLFLACRGIHTGARSRIIPRPRPTHRLLIMGVSPRTSEQPQAKAFPQNRSHSPGPAHSQTPGISPSTALPGSKYHPSSSLFPRHLQELSQCVHILPPPVAHSVLVLPSHRLPAPPPHLGPLPSLLIMGVSPLTPDSPQASYHVLTQGLTPRNSLRPTLHTPAPGSTHSTRSSP